MILGSHESRLAAITRCRRRASAGKSLEELARPVPHETDPSKPQVDAAEPLLEELPGHDHALGPVSALGVSGEGVEPTKEPLIERAQDNPSMLTDVCQTHEASPQPADPVGPNAKTARRWRPHRLWSAVRSHMGHKGRAGPLAHRDSQVQTRRSGCIGLPMQAVLGHPNRGIFPKPDIPRTRWPPAGGRPVPASPCGEAAVTSQPPGAPDYAVW